MALPGYVQTCTAVDGAGECTATAYMPQESALPTLSTADAKEIGLAIALLWALAFVFRRLIRLLDQL